MLELPFGQPTGGDCSAKGGMRKRSEVFFQQRKFFYIGKNKNACRPLGARGELEAGATPLESGECVPRVRNYSVQWVTQ